MNPNTSSSLVAYWLDAGITKTYPCPRLREIATYLRPDGSPQITFVPLFVAAFRGTPDNFAPPFISWGKSIQSCFDNGDVAYLQSKGIKVVLSVVGNSGDPNGIGWSCVPEGQNKAFAEWLNSEVVQIYGLDGIDIDDEFAKCTGTTAQLVATVQALRNLMPDKIISKALWRDEEAFQGTNLGELLSFGCTMAYGWDFYTMTSTANQYIKLGLPADKLCIGVQAGPSELSWMTSISETQQLTTWAQENGLMGMMLFSFSQDILNFTNWPQQQKPYPSPGDHSWQEAIIKLMTS